jgi:hypothetical protein
VLIKLATIWFLAQGFWASSSVAEGKSPIALRVIPLGDQVKIVVENSGTKPIYIYDSLMGRSIHRLPVWIQARGANSIVLTRANFLPDDYYSPSLLSSHGVVPKLKLMSPRDRLERCVDVRALFTGYPSTPFLDLKKNTREVKVKFRLYLDSKFERHVEAESDWFPFSFRA